MNGMKNSETWNLDPFPTTNWPELNHASFWPDERQSGDALSNFFERYKPPLVMFVSRKIKSYPDLPHLDAEDIVHDFFTSQVLQKRFLSAAKSSSGSIFRKFLVRSLRNFLFTEIRTLKTAKRGGRINNDPISEETFETQFISGGVAGESLDLCWFANLLLLALKRQCDSARSTSQKRQFISFYLRHISTLISSSPPMSFQQIAEVTGAKTNKQASANCAFGKAAFLCALQSELDLHCKTKEEVHAEISFMLRITQKYYAFFCEKFYQLIQTQTCPQLLQDCLKMTQDEPLSS